MRSSKCITCHLIIACGCWLPGVVGIAQGPAAPVSPLNPTRTAPRTDSQALGITPEREAAARTFAKRHAPELEVLLDYLNDHRPRQYRRAVADLFRTSERLAGIRERDPERYALELHAWQVKSRIEVLVAKLQVHPTPELRTALQTQVKTLIRVQRDVLLRERQRLQQRLRKLEDSIRTTDPENSAVVERQMTEFLQRGKRKPSKRQPTAKPK